MKDEYSQKLDKNLIDFIVGQDVGYPNYSRWVEKAEHELDRGDKSAILAYFFDNPTDYAPEKSRRLKELDEELKQIESKWLTTQSKLDKGDEKSLL